MYSANAAYPVRPLIRQKAQLKLIEALKATGEEGEVNQALFSDITNTLLQPKKTSAVYQGYANRSQAIEVEETTAGEIVATYLRMHQWASFPWVKKLNQLLEQTDSF